MTTSLRSAAAGLAATTLAAGLLVLAPTSASAAWFTSTQVHGAELQACRATVDGGPAVKLRLDNRDARHGHRGGITRLRGSASRTYAVQPAAGRVSAVRVVPVRAGDSLESFVSEINGPGAGGGLSRADLPRC